MKIATLGYDKDLLDLIRCIAASNQYTLAACFDIGAGKTKLESIVPLAVNTNESWEALLTGSVADVIFVASRPEEVNQAQRRDDQLRKLVQSSSPLVLIQPSCEMIVGLELEMIRHDSDCPMIPYHPVLYHPSYVALRDLLRGSQSASFGKVEQLVWERQASDRRRASVLHSFSHDAFVLRDLLVNVSHVAAMGASGGDDALANLGVHLTGDSDRLARWSIAPVSDVAGAKLTVIGSTQTATLLMPDESFAYKLTVDGTVRESAGKTPPEQILAIAARQLSSAAADKTSWEQACRALELEDAVERSVRRGRTIELHHEMVTERETFKSMMAAGGCGLLLWVMLLLLIAGIVEGLQLPIRDTFLWRLWPLILFAPLGLFLLLQLLQLAFAKRGPDVAAEHSAKAPTDLDN